MVGGSDLITSFRSQAGRGFVPSRMETTGGFINGLHKAHSVCCMEVGVVQSGLR